MSDVVNILDKENKKKISDKEAREILKPTCDEELSEDEHPAIKMISKYFIYFFSYLRVVALSPLPHLWLS